MATPAIPLQISLKSHDALIQYCKKTTEATWGTQDFRNKLQYIDLEFYRENMNATGDHRVAQLANRGGDKKKVQDMCMPLVESQVETGVAFLTSVFLQDVPIFGVLPNPDPQKQQQADAMEAVLAENAVRGGWAAEIIMFFRDGLKYNFHGLEVTWDKKTIYSPALDLQQGKTPGTKNKEVLWEGNCIRRIDPYNMLFDWRVTPSRMHIDGEFVGYTELMSRIALKQFIADLPQSMNVTKAFGTGFVEKLYFMPKINPWENYNMQRLVGAMDWSSWAFGERKMDYKNIYAVTTRYCRLLPSEFGISQVPNQNSPQIFKIITVNDEYVIYAERMTNAHNFLPIIVGQPYNDGLAYQTKGMGEKLIPLQDLASAAWNARLASQRRSISDRALYDPSRIRESDVNSDSPSPKIPVKSSSYNKNVQDAYHAIPFEDRNSGSFTSDAREFIGMANQLSGQNPAQQGQFVKGNKTLAEYQDVQGHSSGRQETGAIFIEHQVFGPVKEILKLNILQYQPNGPVLSPANGETYQVNPQQLRDAALTFKITDGLQPKDKLIDTPTLQVALQVIGTSPALQQEYDLGRLFSYLMSIKNVDLTQFELTTKQQKAAQQAAAQQTLQQSAAENAGKHAAPQPAGTTAAPPALTPAIAPEGGRVLGV